MVKVKEESPTERNQFDLIHSLRDSIPARKLRLGYAQCSSKISHLVVLFKEKGIYNSSKSH